MSHSFIWWSGLQSFRSSGVDLVGFSLGGMIAQQRAPDHPQLVRSLILLGTGPRGGEGMTFTNLSPEEQQPDPIAFLLAALFTSSESSQNAGRAGVSASRRYRGNEVFSKGKTALVTGASRGIGRATALVLGEAGARILVHYGKSASDAESVVTAIRSKAGRADAVQVDLGSVEGASLLAKQLRSLAAEGLDVLVLNAGISKAPTLKDYSLQDFDDLFATNVRSLFFLVQQFAPFLGKGANIILASSLGARFVVARPIWRTFASRVCCNQGSD